jgi:Calcineurin-like phosphoesterase
MRADWLVPLGALFTVFALTAACGSSDDSGATATGGKSGSGGGGGSGNASGSGGTGGTGNATGGGGTGNASGTGGAAGTASGGSAGSGNTGGTSGVPPDKQNLRVAFFGDSSSGTNFKNVAGLIKSENADFVVALGDYDYSANPSAWISAMTGVLGADYPIFGAAGNHDAGTWSAYADEFSKRMASNGVTPDDADLGDEKYAIDYHGIKIVFVGQNGNNTEFASFIDSQFQNDDHIFRICAWHKNQQAMQVGGKGNEMGWDVYENCRKAGAIMVAGHEHSYERTKTLTSMQNQTVDSSCSDPGSLCLGPGRAFAAVAGLGGNSIRDQQRCTPSSYPYGCNGEWAFIYTNNQNADYGAMFIDFYVNGDPKKAHGYFKNVNNQTVDEFDIAKD